MLPLCSHKVARSVKTNYRLKLKIKTTLGLLSSCFDCSFSSNGIDLQIQHLFLSSAPADLSAPLLDKRVSKPVFPQCEAAQVHKTWSFTLVPLSLQHSPSHLPTCSNIIFDQKQKGRYSPKSHSCSSESINCNLTTAKSLDKILSSWSPTSFCCSVYIKLRGMCRRPDRLKSWCLPSRTHLTLGFHTIFLGCLHSC